MSRRNFGFGFFVLGGFIVATACGGTVTDGTGNPSEQLRSGSVDRCRAACATIVACGLDSSSCDCAPCVCPDAGTGCSCSPCTCGMQTTASCESDCAKYVKEVLDEEPVCDAPMLALLNCLGTATCSDGEMPCKAEEQTFKECGISHRPKDNVTPPSSYGTPAPSVGSDRVSCRIASGFGSAAADGGVPSTPGELSCGSGYEDCSDGSSYKVECRTTTSADLMCTCSVDGVPGSTFVARTCNQTQGELNMFCGWNLGD